MDITKYNFEEEFDSIKTAIEESDFIAIDGEFTGLNSGSGNQIGSFDTPSERYTKIKNGVSDFLLIQFGLCTFKANDSEKRYEARPYNFYIFPRPCNNQCPDRRFLCQSSSIDFLIRHDFDFNKLFKEGIPYLTHDQELKLKGDLERRQADRNNSSLNSSLSSPKSGVKKVPFVVPDDHKEFIAAIRTKIDAFLKTEDEEPLALPPCNAFQRKLIYRSVEDNYPLVFLETKTGENKERFLQVSKCKDQSRMEEMENARKEVERMALDLQVGFSKVMRLITESGKLVVGHNMYLDVIHSVNHFYGSIPEELSDFKEMIKLIFPRLLDTKLVANTSPFKEYFLSTGLEDLSVTLKHPPFKPAEVELAEGFTKYRDGGGVFHEAGYDAFVTGSCFASLVNFLGRYQNPGVTFLLPTHQSIEPFVNKLYMMRIADIPYVNLAGQDVEPSREHVFHVTFPEEWRAQDLFQLFKPYGNVQIGWLTKTSAYVGLMKTNNAKLVLSGLNQSSELSFHITTYTSHRQMLQMKSFDKPSVSSSSTHHTPTASLAAGSKRKSPPPTDVIYPPTKLQRKSVTKETIPYPSIPEEEEKLEEDNSLEESHQQGGEEEDVGVPVDSGKARSNTTTDDLKRKKKKNENAEDSSPSSNNGKLFEEPDNW